MVITVESATLSLTEAAALAGVSVPTVRRAFDRDRPASGTIIEAGSTGSPERRVDAAWAAQLAVKIGEAKAAGVFGRGKRKPKNKTGGEQPAGQ